MLESNDSAGELSLTLTDCGYVDQDDVAISHPEQGSQRVSTVRHRAQQVLAVTDVADRKETKLIQYTKHESTEEERQKIEMLCMSKPIDFLMQKCEDLQNRKGKLPKKDEMYLQVMQETVTSRMRHLDFNAYHTFIAHLRAVGRISLTKKEDGKPVRQGLFHWQKIIFAILEKRGLYDSSGVCTHAVLEILGALEENGDIMEIDPGLTNELQHNGGIVGEVRHASEARIGVIFDSFQAMKMMEEMGIVDWGLKNTKDNDAKFSLNPWLLRRAVGKRVADDLTFEYIVKRVYKMAGEDGPIVKNRTLYDALLAEEDPEAVLSYCGQLHRNPGLLSILNRMDRWLPSKITGIANILINGIMEINSFQSNLWQQKK